MKVRLPNLLSGLKGKSQIVQDELVKLGEQMVHSAEGTKALALELCHEFEDRFLQHITTGEGSGWKVVASFECNFPNRIKQLPLDRHFDLNNVKRVCIIVISLFSKVLILVHMLALRYFEIFMCLRYLYIDT